MRLRGIHGKTDDSDVGGSRAGGAGGLGFVKLKQIQTAVAQGASFQPPPVAVTTVVAKQEQWSSSLNVIGTIAAVQGVTVSADLPGTIDKINFESGKWVKEGDVLVELDTRQGTGPISCHGSGS